MSIFTLIAYMAGVATYLCPVILFKPAFAVLSIIAVGATVLIARDDVI